MNSLSSTTSLPAPSAKIFDFTQAAADRAKRRCAAGEVVVLDARTPLCAPLEADPGVVVVDPGWFDRTVSALTPEATDKLIAWTIEEADLLWPDGASPTQLFLLSYQALKFAEADGFLQDMMVGTRP
ncbi:hypothetical protein [Pseudomonas sp. JUb96]|uniref:hypothetical protein n=1 Tax=Pseudomonas sp. JUb96 TaxID=2940539 RepID=UPI002227F5EA|nr:hypothetical protein [Pseudomonas sp. JUb96]MCW2267586.1 hypothetical protein [Pseudomonas sp. JUb96]